MPSHNLVPSVANTLAQTLLAQPHLEFAVLVGSRATGSARDDSAWDIALQWSPQLDWLSALGQTETLRRALAGESILCDQVIEAFCKMLGTIAGNLAVTLGARGGIYIGGGIVPRLGERFDRSGFRARFEQKGRFAAYLAQVPTFVITADYPAFVGVSAMVSEQIGGA